MTNRGSVVVAARANQERSGAGQTFTPAAPGHVYHDARAAGSLYQAQGAGAESQPSFDGYRHPRDSGSEVERQTERGAEWDAARAGRQTEPPGLAVEHQVPTATERTLPLCRRGGDARDGREAEEPRVGGKEPW